MYYNSLDTFYKSKIGAIKNGEQVIFRVKGNFDSVSFVMHKDGENIDDYRKLFKINDYFELTTSFSESGLFFYRFVTNCGNIILGDDYCGVLSDKIEDFQLTIYDSDYCVPSWLKGGIIYQIFPDRFYSSKKEIIKTCGRIIHKDKNEKPIYKPNENGEVLNNDFFGGDLHGIEEKLPYIKSLGVSAIYLNPIFKSYSNHRYDTGDYFEIDDMLGSKQDLISLINSANNLGIKIILDGVFNHTGVDSIYFNKYGSYKSIGAFQSKDSPYYSWFNFTDYPNKYQSWWGIKTIPTVNKKSGFIDFIAGENGVIEYYTQLGIGGWRLDVVDELPSNFVEKIRSATKKINKESMVIGEVWEDASNKVSYSVRRRYFQGKELDSVMNYPLKNAIIDFVVSGNEKNFSFTIDTQLDHYPKMVRDSLMNILSTHDTKRIISALSNVNIRGKTKNELANIILSQEEYNLSKNRLKIASLLQYTVFGVPSLYYGDEIGMQGFFDPYNRCYFSWDKIDSELLLWYSFLGRLRNKYSAFIDGEFVKIFSQNGCYAFIRKNEDCEVFIAVNCGEKEKIISFDGELFNEIDGKLYKDKYILKQQNFVVFVKNC